MKGISAETPPEPTMPPPQTLHEGGKFVFRAGLVPTDCDEYVILHRNKTTLIPSLPQGPCEWLLQSGADEASVPMLESFEATAVRIRKTQLSHKNRILGHHPKDSTQPYKHKSGTRPNMRAPFLLQTETTPDGTLEVTAWFQVLFDQQEHEWKGITAFGRGSEWLVELWEIKKALKVLPESEREILDKAVSARKTYHSDDSDDDDDIEELD